MKYKNLTPVLMVKNINETVAYYCDVLDFQFVLAVLQEGKEVITTKDDPRLKIFAMLKRDEIEIMFQSESGFKEDFPDYQPKITGDTLGLYIDVDDFSHMVEKLEGKTNIIKPPRTTFYGKREISIRDCNNYIITFAQDV